MGARYSKRSVDISAAAKKDKETNSEEKLERIDEPEVAKQNGTTPRPEEPKEGSGDAATAQVNGDDKPETKDEDKDKAEPKDEETEKKEPQTPESPVEEAKSPEEEKSEKKKKDKKKEKKWSFRSISFSRKNKPSMSKDDSISSDLAKAAETVAEVVEGETAALTEEKKDATTPSAEDKKEEEKDAAPLTSALSSISSAASKAVEEVKEKAEEKKEEVKSEVVNKAEEIIEKGEAIVQKTVEQVVETSSSIVESTTSKIITTVSETSEIFTSSSQLLKDVLEVKSEDAPAPPLPASPPPTEAPPPTPNVTSPPEPEEVNGGGEGMAEMPEENGLGSDAKIDDDEEELPKMNGHNEVSPVKEAEHIIDAIKSEAIETMTILAENNVELVTTGDAKSHADE